MDKQQQSSKLKRTTSMEYEHTTSSLKEEQYVLALPAQPITCMPRNKQEILQPVHVLKKPVSKAIEPNTESNETSTSKTPKSPPMA